MSSKVMEIVTNKIINSLENGVAPWRQGWKSTRPRNLISGKPYRGANALFTHPMVTGFTEPGFLTFNQINKMGATIRKGERLSQSSFTGRVKTRRPKKNLGSLGSTRFGILLSLMAFLQKARPEKM